MRHTPTPWALSLLHERQDRQTGSVLSRTVQMVHAGSGALLMSHDGSPEGMENERLVLRAVNAHAELLAACEATLTAWHSDSRNMWRAEPAYVVGLRAAIASARREE